MARDLLIIFGKAPRAGEVKTRIANVIGPGPACEAYLALVSVLVGNLRTLQNVQLRFTPSDALLEISKWLQPTWTAAPQGSGDLGERLRAAFRDAFAAGVERVVVIGSDCPDITREDIEVAWRALETNDVVIGPAEDGGYWLIGLRTDQPRLFENIPWSSSSVFEKTVERANAAKLSKRLLRKLPDIDTIEDLRRYQARAAQQ